MKPLLIDKLKGNPKLLIIIFYLTKFIVSILSYKIFQVENIIGRHKIMNTLAYDPYIKLAQKMKTELMAFNTQWNYFFIISDHSSYNTMMLTHEGNVPFHLLYIIKSFSEKPIFIDVGAHHGSYILAFHQYCKMIVAIEANPLNYSFLRHNLALNKIDNCISINCIVTSHDGFADLYTSELSVLHSIKKSRVGEPKQKIRIPAYKLDTLLIGKLALDRIDIIKIDVEGAEKEVLIGMHTIINRFKPILVIEVFQRNYKTIRGYLNSHGYDYKIIYESIDPITNEKYFYLLARCIKEK
jgi:FkbM family methyltransferase